ncbi:MAG: DUF2231 domain-containing protein [Candidatus Marinimicrobia bacterium]|nr:DUF2231 domain-containing protein [Candidatus Neomarinimicrobiota bacterium]MCF7829043.1 DUF2231 domain-containing protein [Candidatus Neomarinimicrobiota bacterium]MCF7881820.1 DUF2231 domain-containing protein [Candidatus Neomarinimicrobiota bacterium]
MLDLHPFVVGFAVALLTVSVVFDLLAITTDRPHLQTVGWWNLFLGFFAALFAVITGLYAKNSAIFTDGVDTVLGYHQYFGIATACVFTLLFIWRSNMDRVIRKRWQALYLTVAIIGTVLVLTTGFLGGQLVFEHGTNVQEVKELQIKVEQLQADTTHMVASDTLSN